MSHVWNSNLEIDYEKIRREAIKYANKKKCGHMAEDFAQECCLYAFNKRTNDIYVDRRFTDYLRRNYGRTGPRGNVNAPPIFVTYDDKYHGASGVDPSDGCDPYGFGILFENVSHVDKLIYILVRKFDVQIYQIADSHGVTKSRISQILSGVQKTIDKNVARLKSGRRSRKRLFELEKILQTRFMKCGISSEGLPSFPSAENTRHVEASQ